VTRFHKPVPTVGGAYPTGLSAYEMDIDVLCSGVWDKQVDQIAAGRAKCLTMDELYTQLAAHMSWTETAGTDYRLTRYEINQSNAILGTVTREYYVYTPSDYVPGVEKPVVISFHGGGGNAMAQYDLARQDLVSEYFKDNGDDSFILVLPSGYDTHWNAAPGERYECSQVNIDDVGFIQSMMTAIGALYSVDTTRVYGSGFSNGARMVQRVALDNPGFFAAIGPVSGGLSNRIWDGWDSTDHTALESTETTYIGHASKSGEWNGRGSYTPYYVSPVVLANIPPTPVHKIHAIGDLASKWSGYGTAHPAVPPLPILYDSYNHQFSFTNERDKWVSVNSQGGAMTDAGNVTGIDLVDTGVAESVDAGRDAPNPLTAGGGHTIYNHRKYSNGDQGDLNIASKVEYYWFSTVGEPNPLNEAGHTWPQGGVYTGMLGKISQEFNAGIIQYAFFRQFTR